MTFYCFFFFAKIRIIFQTNRHIFQQRKNVTYNPHRRETIAMRECVNVGMLKKMRKCDIVGMR